MAAEVANERKRTRPAKYPDLEKALLLWIKDMRAHDIPLSGPVMLARQRTSPRSWFTTTLLLQMGGCTDSTSVTTLLSVLCPEKERLLLHFRLFQLSLIRTEAASPCGSH
ncbi:hypothetical protein ISCGN_013675 [Ixodes scapularis]